MVDNVSSTGFVGWSGVVALGGVLIWLFRRSARFRKKLALP